MAAKAKRTMIPFRESHCWRNATKVTKDSKETYICVSHPMAVMLRHKGSWSVVNGGVSTPVAFASNGNAVALHFGAGRELLYVKIAHVEGAGAHTDIEILGYAHPDQKTSSSLPMFFAVDNIDQVQSFARAIDNKSPVDHERVVRAKGDAAASPLNPLSGEEKHESETALRDELDSITHSDGGPLEKLLHKIGISKTPGDESKDVDMETEEDDYDSEDDSSETTGEELGEELEELHKPEEVKRLSRWGYDCSNIDMTILNGTSSTSSSSSSS